MVSMKYINKIYWKENYLGKDNLAKQYLSYISLKLILFSLCYYLPLLFCPEVSNFCWIKTMWNFWVENTEIVS